MASNLNGKYSSFTSDVNGLIAKASQIYVNISLDNEGSVAAKSNNGSDIIRKLLTSMNYTYPYTDVASGQSVLGNFVISFSDGSHIVINDDNSSFWYILENVEPAVYKQLI